MSAEPAPPLLRLSPRAVVSELDGGAVLLDLKRKRYLVLNETGGCLCAELARGATPAALAEELARRFEVSREQADGDVRALLTDLRAEGLLAEG